MGRSTLPGPGLSPYGLIEVVEVTNEQVLAEIVRAWVDSEFPGQPGAVNRAASVAAVFYAQGASIAEACEQAPAFFGSWIRHPAHQKADQLTVLQLAS